MIDNKHDLQQVFAILRNAHIAAKIAAAMSKNLFDGELTFYVNKVPRRNEIRCVSWINPICFDVAMMYASAYNDAITEM